jgi:hypothetical protein
VDPLFKASEGEKVFVEFNEKCAHVFEKSTEKTIF